MGLSVWPSCQKELPKLAQTPSDLICQATHDLHDCLVRCPTFLRYLKRSTRYPERAGIPILYHYEHFVQRHLERHFDLP